MCTHEFSRDVLHRGLRQGQPLGGENAILGHNAGRINGYIWRSGHSNWSSKKDWSFLKNDSRVVCGAHCLWQRGNMPLGCR